MSPTLLLEAEICGAVKLASKRSGVNLADEIRGALKIAVAAPVAGPGINPVVAPKPPMQGSTGVQPPPEPVAPPAGAPPKPATPPANGGAPPPPAQPAAKPGAPYEVTAKQPGTMDTVWNGIKNNWDLAAIPISALAMMFGGKKGKMLGALGMAAGGYGLYNRYQQVQDFSKPENLQAAYKANQAKLQAAPMQKQVEALEGKFTNASAAVTPESAPAFQAAMAARDEMQEAQRTANDTALATKDPAAIQASQKAVQDATQKYQAAMAADPTLKPVMDLRDQADHAKFQYEKAVKPWTDWSQKNSQLMTSLQGVHSMAPGVLKSQIQSTIPGASDRNVQDFMFRVGMADKPAAYGAQAPMTPEEHAADTVMNWALTNPEAAAQMKSGESLWSVIEFAKARWDRSSKETDPAWMRKEYPAAYEPQAPAPGQP